MGNSGGANLNILVTGHSAMLHSVIIYLPRIEEISRKVKGSVCQFWQTQNGDGWAVLCSCILGILEKSLFLFCHVVWQKKTKNCIDKSGGGNHG